ncbi:MAG TPA: hypothetical protein PKV71_21035, partial [Calditrichia bacterium]|nr:hypothetical protein [Calditrichia bacterium]
RFGRFFEAWRYRKKPALKNPGTKQLIERVAERFGQAGKDHRATLGNHCRERKMLQECMVGVIY